MSQNEIHYLDEEERARKRVKKVSNHSHLTIEINEKCNGGMEEWNRENEGFVRWMCNGIEISSSTAARRGAESDKDFPN